MTVSAETLDNEARTKRYVFFVSVLTSFITPFMGSSVNVAIPQIGESLRLDAIALNWVVTGFLLAAAACLLPLGRVADLYGRKRVFLVGLAVHTLPSGLCAAAQSGTWLILGRVLQGVGGAMVFGTGMAIVTSVFSVGERGKIIGFNVGVVYLGLSMGPVLGGLVTHHLGWRALFLLHLALGACAFSVAFLGLKGEWKNDDEASFDLLSSILYAAALTALMYGIAMLTTAKHAPAILLAGLVLLTGFIHRQLVHKNPLFDIRLFRNPAFAFSNVAALIHYSATFAIGFLMSLFLQTVKGLSAQSAGFVLLSQPLVMALVSPLAGRWSDWLQPRLIASLGMALTCGGIAVFSFLDSSFPVSLVALNLVLVGFGFGLFSSPNTNAVMSAVEPSHYGVASATLSTMRVVGQAMSMAMVNLGFAFYLKGHPVTPDVAVPLVQSLRTTFSIFAILCLVGIWASLARGRVGPSHPSEPRT
ncbi:MAG: MFS transporter [Candidatus Hydrogenedentes bacterium]|nr:MFS transporter [Candidatus Hydrogenedentota bacterium]